MARAAVLIVAPSRVLGISCHYHDAAACLIEDGRIVAAAEEERFTRRKHDAAFPTRAAAYCLAQAGIAPGELDRVVFYEKPLLKFERIVAGAAATWPRSHALFLAAMETWLSEKLWVKDAIGRGLGRRGAILFGEHHLSHAASAFYPSPFGSAAVVTADAVGEWTTTAIGVGHDRELELVEEIRYPHSLGLLYSAFTAYLGFEPNEGEYKLMGMAAYGRPRYVDRVRKVIDLADDGSFRLDMRYFRYHRSLSALTGAFIDLFGPARAPDAAPDERHFDVAASVQLVLEEAVLGLARRARSTSGCRDLCMAGGVALNVLANARVLREAGFDRVWVQPAAGDAGGALGAAAHVSHQLLGAERSAMTTAYLGPGYTDAEILDFLREHGIPHDVLSEGEIAPRTARLIEDRKVVGWFQGRMEFGPRALGARSILADPRDAAMKERLNEKVKHREPFRPFAPTVLRDASSRLFDFGGPSADPDSPFMLLTARVRDAAKSAIPAATHVDGTARVQTLRQDQHPRFHALLEAFDALTGVPAVLNTSFNVRGEPIVCTPADAFNTFSHTDVDHLVMGTALIDAVAKRRLAPYPGGRDQGVEVIV
jgi:carbamoyltransferase